MWNLICSLCGFANLWAVSVVWPICARHQGLSQEDHAIAVERKKKNELSGGGMLDKYASLLSPWGLVLPFTHDHSTANSTGTSPWGVGQWITTVRRLFSLVFWFIKKVICSSQKSQEDGLLLLLESHLGPVTVTSAQSTTGSQPGPWHYSVNLALEYGGRE